MGGPDFDLETVDRLLTTTRSVRKRLDLDRPVPPELVELCLDIALQAPTGSNLQGWRWMVVTDPARRAEISSLYAKVMGPYHAGMEAAFGSRPEAGRLLSSSRHLAQVLDRVPVIVIPCLLGSPDLVAMQLGAVLGEGFTVSRNLAASGFYGSIWPAVWSFMLALRSRGLGSALTTMHLAFEHEIGQLLGIPDGVTQIGLIPVAFYRGEGFHPASRRPASEITYWNGWKQPRG